MITTTDIAAALQEIGEDLVGNEDAWKLIEMAAVVFLPEYSMVSWDGILDDFFAYEDDSQDEENVLYRLLVHTVADAKAVVVKNAILG